VAPSSELIVGGVQDNSFSGLAMIMEVWPFVEVVTMRLSVEYIMSSGPVHLQYQS